MRTAALFALAVPLAAFQPTPTRIRTDRDPRPPGPAAPGRAAIDGRRCDTVDDRRATGGTALHLHVDDDGDTLHTFVFVFTTAGRCAEAVVTGDVGLSAGGRAACHANRALASSAGDLRAVLRQVPRRVQRSPEVRSALSEGSAAIASDGDRRTLLLQYVASDDRDLLMAGLRGVRTVTSDGDRAAVLVTAAAHALRPNDAELRGAFFDALATVRSDGDAAAVLVTVAGQRLITTRALRERYLAAARGLESDGEYRRVLSALAGRHFRIRDL